MRSIKFCRHGLFFLILLGLLSIMASCASDDSNVNADGDGDSANQIPCTLSYDCPTGTVCGADNFCVTNTDGDVADGDFVASKVLRLVPDGSLDFGEVEIYDTPEAQVTIYNDGNSVLHLYDANWIEPQIDNPFVLVGYMESAIQPNQSFTFKVKFEAIDFGEVDGVLEINNDSDNSPKVKLNVKVNAVPQAGEAEIGSQPAAVQFEEHAIGTLPSQVRLRVGNKSTEGSTLYLTNVYLESQGASPYYLEFDAEITEEAPGEITGGNSLPFTVFFNPRAVNPSYKDKVIIEYHTNTNSTMQVFEVAIKGNAIAGVLIIQPSELDFGLVTANQTAELDIKIISNYGDGDLTVINTQMFGLNNWQSFFQFTDPPANTVLAPAEDHEFKISFTPDTEGDFSCDLMIKTDYQGTTFFFPVTATGSSQNQKPIARVAQRENGPDINGQIETPIGTLLQLFGDISFDPDGDTSLMTFSWQLQKPASSLANIVPNTTSPNVNLLVDVAGTYGVTLVVTDELGKESNPKTVMISADAGVSTVSVEATFSGISGASDVDLSWILPSGGSCNENNVAATGYCMLPIGSGDARFEGCGSASICTTERMTHVDAPDGRYQIRIIFDENCPDTTFNCPLGFGEESAVVDINIYIDGVPTFRIDNEALNDKGDQKTFNLVRSSGVWQSPERVN